MMEEEMIHNTIERNPSYLGEDMEGTRNAQVQ